jgi:hypothetical protein
MPLGPEDIAREQIDRMLVSAWTGYDNAPRSHAAATALRQTADAQLPSRGNPWVDHFLKIINILHANERVRLRVEAHKARHREHKHYKPLGFCL